MLCDGEWISWRESSMVYNVVYCLFIFLKYSWNVQYLKPLITGPPANAINKGVMNLILLLHTCSAIHEATSWNIKSYNCGLEWTVVVLKCSIQVMQWCYFTSNLTRLQSWCASYSAKLWSTGTYNCRTRDQYDWILEYTCGLQLYAVPISKRMGGRDCMGGQGVGQMQRGFDCRTRVGDHTMQWGI